jgi:glycosidase
MRPPTSHPLHLGLLVLLGATAGCQGATTGPAAPAAPSGPTASGAAAASAPPSPIGARPPVFYQVFVRSFADSGSDGIGDLRGLTARLDYLNDGVPGAGDDLEVDGLWLMPINPSPSYHGYDVTDYDQVHPDYGTLQDLDALVQAAHRRGMRVIIDFVANHTSDKHPWFQESQRPGSARRDHYVWSDSDRGWKQPFGGHGPVWHRGQHGGHYYGVFWSGMPDLNYRNPTVRDEIKRAAELWLRRGLDGLRLDAARYLIEDGPGPGLEDRPGTHAFWRELAGHLRHRHPRALLVGEVWADTPVIASYFGSTKEVPFGDELPLNFNFPLSASIVSGIREGSATALVRTLGDVARHYPRGVTDAPFLTNHDQIRIGTQLGGDPAMLRLAAAVLLTLPGVPFIYYGEELGMLNGPGNADEEKRTPMPWTAAPGGGFTTGKPWRGLAPGQAQANVATQLRDPASLLSRYRSLIRLRKRVPALSSGDLQLVEPSGGEVVAWVRRHRQDQVLVVHNFSGGRVTRSWPLLARAREVLHADPGVTLQGPAGAGTRSLELPPRTSAVLGLATAAR